MHLRRSLLALLMILWLPLQGYTAIAMPFCKHALHGAQDSRAIASADQHVGHNGSSEHVHHGVGSSPEHGASTGNHQHDSADLDCNDCGACHLACSPVAPLAQHDFVSAESERFTMLSPSVPPLFVPEQPKRPPLSTAV